MSEPTYKIAQALHERRAAVGLKEYGQHLSADSPGCMLVHALEESADKTNYLIAEVQRRRESLILLIEVAKYLKDEGQHGYVDTMTTVIDLLGGEAALAKYDEIMGTVAENATVATDPRDEALRKIADGAEEDISDLAGVGTHVICKFCGDVPHDEECPHTIATSALAATPAQSLAAHDAALLRRLAAESAPGERADIAPWLMTEAERIEKEAGDGKA